MANPVVQTVSANNGAGASTLVLTVASTAIGSLLALVVAFGPIVTISTVTDNIGNTWTAHNAGIDSPIQGTYFDSPGAITGVTTVTVTFSGPVVASGVFAELSGVGPVVDKSTSATGVSITPSSGATSSVAVAGEIVIGWLASLTTTTPTAGTGYTLIATNTAVANVAALEYLQTNVIAAQTAGFNTSNFKWVCGVITYPLLQPASGSGKGAPMLACLGAGSGGSGGNQYLINTTAGLANWRTARAAGVAGTQPVDIVCGTDSIMEGTDVVNQVTDELNNIPHILKLQLQNTLNPSGVPGGFGFMSFGCGFGNSNVSQFATKFGTISNTQVFQSIRGNTFGWTNNNANGANGGYMTLDGTASRYVRGGITSVQYIGSAEQGIATGSRVDAGTGTPGATMIGAGNVFTGTHSQDQGAGSFYGGARWGTATSPSDSNFITGFTASSKNFVQWASALLGGLNSEYDGVLCYNGDEHKGFRVHNMGHFGISILPSGAGCCAQYFTDYGAGANTMAAPGGGQQGPGNVGTVWGDNTDACRRAKLFILDPITNERGQNQTPDNALATFITQYTAFINYLKALPSAPSILLLIPPMSNSTGLVADTSATSYLNFAAAIRSMAVTLGCACYDVGAEFGNQQGSTLWLASGYTTNIFSNAGIHPTLAGYRYIANRIANLLLT